MKFCSAPAPRENHLSCQRHVGYCHWQNAWHTNMLFILNKHKKKNIDRPDGLSRHIDCSSAMYLIHWVFNWNLFMSQKLGKSNFASHKITLSLYISLRMPKLILSFLHWITLSTSHTRLTSKETFLLHWCANRFVPNYIFVTSIVINNEHLSRYGNFCWGCCVHVKPCPCHILSLH